MTKNSWHPLRTYNVEEHDCSTCKICIFGNISLNKFLSKICRHPLISWLFLVTRYFSWKKILWPPGFSWSPYLKDNDSPFIRKTVAVAIVPHGYINFGWKSKKLNSFSWIYFSFSFLVYFFSWFRPPGSRALDQGQNWPFGKSGTGQRTATSFKILLR